MTIRVMLADDQPLVRAGIAMLLESEPAIAVVGEADNGADAIAMARRLLPDIVLMDVRMPTLDGVEATRQITADGFTTRVDSPVKVLVLTTYHVDEAVYAALRAGASGFLLKDAAPDELVAAVKALAAGDAWLDPAVARGLLDEFAARPTTSRHTSEDMQQLTPRERQVLTLMAHGLSNGEIATHLVVGQATVKTHVGRIIMKLEVRDRAQAVVAAYQSGLVKPGDRPPAPDGP